MTSRPSRFDVAIVGGGLWGLSLAWHLAKAGRRVVVLEKRHVGSGASSRNVGRVRSIQLTAELTRLGLAAQAKHLGLGRELGRSTLCWRAGYAWVLYSEEECERFRALLPMLKQEGCPAQLLDARATLKVSPVLAGGERPLGAMYGARDIVVHHDAVLYAYRQACLALGVDLREQCTVEAIDIVGGRAAGVHTAHGLVAADGVVNATAGWSREVSAMAGQAIPNTPYRREAFVTESAHPFMSAAITFYSPTEGWFNQTLRGELVAGSIRPDEAPGLDHSGSWQSLQSTGALLMRKAPRLGGLRVVRQWAGVYDMTPDRKPLVGQSRVAGFYQFCGCNGRGFNLGPILAQLLSEEIVSGRRDELLKGFEATRFDGMHDSRVDMGDYYAGYAKPATLAEASR
jgi:sarcosine oxidase subunit beta